MVGRNILDSLQITAAKRIVDDTMISTVDFLNDIYFALFTTQFSIIDQDNQYIS